MIRNMNSLYWIGRPCNFSGTFGPANPEFNAKMGTLPLNMSCHACHP
jgi:hypothetical protein